MKYTQSILPDVRLLRAAEWAVATFYRTAHLVALSILTACIFSLDKNATYKAMFKTELMDIILIC